MNLRTNVAVAVVARHPQVDGPVTLDSFVCPASRFYVVAPRFDAKASFNEAFTSVDGSGRMAISTLTAGANGLAAFIGDITYKGSLASVDGRGEAVGAEVAHGDVPRPSVRGSTAPTSSDCATARSPWSAILPPTIRRSTPRCSTA